MDLTSVQYIIATLVILNILGFILLFESKKSLKHCEANVSPFCPVFSCPNYDDKGNLITKNASCGYRPWRCPNGGTNCTNDEICMGTTKE